MNNDVILIDEYINGNDYCEVFENGILSVNCLLESGWEVVVVSDVDLGYRFILSFS